MHLPGFTRTFEKKKSASLAEKCRLWRSEFALQETQNIFFAYSEKQHSELLFRNFLIVLKAQWTHLKPCTHFIHLVEFTCVSWLLVLIVRVIIGSGVQHKPWGNWKCISCLMILMVSQRQTVPIKSVLFFPFLISGELDLLDLVNAKCSSRN